MSHFPFSVYLSGKKMLVILIDKNSNFDKLNVFGLKKNNNKRLFPVNSSSQISALVTSAL